MNTLRKFAVAESGGASFLMVPVWFAAAQFAAMDAAVVIAECAAGAVSEGGLDFAEDRERDLLRGFGADVEAGGSMQPGRHGVAAELRELVDEAAARKIGRAHV